MTKKFYNMIKINNLDFAYKNTQVFKHISLEFKKGNIYGLLGENGVGKTTLLKLICGLQKPQHGSVTVDGHIPSMRQPQFLQNVYFLPEEVITEDTTPEKFVQKIGVFYPRYDFALFNQLMKELEVDLAKKFNELSHGQKKKALLACALSLQTDYLFLDEPTNGLDIPSKALFRKVISQYCSDATTVIISTHQVKDVENLIDPIVILDKDDVLLNASFAEITDKKLTVESTMGVAITDEDGNSDRRPIFADGTAIEEVLVSGDTTKPEHDKKVVQTKLTYVVDVRKPYKLTPDSKVNTNGLKVTDTKSA